MELLLPSNEGVRKSLTCSTACGDITGVDSKTKVSHSCNASFRVVRKDLFRLHRSFIFGSHCFSGNGGTVTRIVFSLAHKLANSENLRNIDTVTVALCFFCDTGPSLAGLVGVGDIEDGNIKAGQSGSVVKTRSICLTTQS
jgi:hypothetical protein